ncbi:hypothetical protein PPL19_03110 [Pseudomonas psychrotolerans L19]|uniref:hypothetical protein n=1 Tax=Pseudomonas oryzihabitans TaxID=47885 RepID=UPI00023A38F3|nr:hypothetical protein [Pseudomonas psychrotolerans]EHK73197.1 hypothetical protein PPL19_03110 [Pseudomonas psychrotolerans L19]MBA1180690.1 hypothetical protein [Pseudomonas psychrotolerans]MBA1214174.1 hypothetical protein [Pseudomonas psychrotolerans]
MNAHVQGLPVFVAIDGDFFRVDTETGELLGYPAAIRTHTVELDQGSDTAFPAQAKSATQLARAVSVHDQWSTQLMYYADRVIDLLDQGASSEAVRIFKRLCSSLEGRNIWFGQLKELGDSLGLPERSVKRAVAELKAANLLRVEKQGRGQPSRVLVHPWFGFRGDRSLQDQYIKDWTK